MKIKEGFVMQKLGSKYVIISAGGLEEGFNGIIKTNESGAYLWELLQEEHTEHQLVELLMQRYGINKEMAVNDVNDFLRLCHESNFLVDD
ncbi:MAG: PqqD family protein [Eubacterium sp.]